MTQPELFQKTINDKFSVWVHTPSGREIANQFIRASCGLQNAGWKKYGAKRIIEGIRWNIHLEHGPSADDFKCNNNHTSRLARFAEQHEPRLEGFFEKRMLKS